MNLVIVITNKYDHKRLLTKHSKNDLGEGFKALREDLVFNNYPPPSHDLGSVILLVIYKLSSFFSVAKKKGKFLYANLCI